MVLEPAMTDAFAPLVVSATTRSPEGTVFRLKVIPQASAVPAFQPLQSAPPQSAAPVHTHAAHTSCPPKVTLQRDGDRVTQIRLECGCGEVFDLTCGY